MIYAACLIGCVLLYKGGDWLLDGVIGIGQKLRLSAAMIGLILVSLGTSAPELFVSVGSALQGHGGMAAGNVVGSNIINVAIVLGIIVCVAVLKIERLLQHQLVAVLGISLLAIWMMSDGQVSRVEGICLIAVMVASFIVAVKNAERNHLQKESVQSGSTQSMQRSTLLTIGGIVTLLIGSESLIWGGLGLAEKLNLPETVVALTVTALGTSLPEIAASVVAVIRRETSMALGNVIGSNLLNIGLVLGVSASVVPLGDIYLTDSTSVFFAGLVIFIFVLSVKPGYLPKWAGYLLVSSYFAYITILLNF